MIDVVFQLLIFFVCAAAGAINEAVLATDLASTGGVGAIQPPPERPAWELEIRIRIAVNETGTAVVSVNGNPIPDRDTLEQQLKTLAEIDATNPVILDIAPQVDWGDVIDLYDRCRRTGLKTINFAINADSL